ncbi:MAG TPA: aldo/keto reductase [Flexilinea sp.]|nr:aldo/keto reductase [Flexilinea sp.]
MEKRRLGRTEMMISPVVYGGIIHMGETQETANRYVSYAVDHGVNYFDVAPSYDDAEQLLGVALKPYRKNVFLACKTMERTASGSLKELENSLKTLQTDHFDVYQLHSITTAEDVDTIFGPDGAMETFLSAKKKGIILNIGFSAHSEEQALRAMDLFDFDTVLFPMNWALGLVRGWGDRVAQKVRESDKGLLCIKTLVDRKWREGENRDEFPKSWCHPTTDNEKTGMAGMKYAFSKGATALVPPGDFKSFNFMLDHIDRVLQNPLNETDWIYLQEEAQKIKDELIFDNQ